MNAPAPAPAPQASSASHQGGLRKPTVMIFDDEQNDLEALKIQLVSRGHDVIAFRVVPLPEIVEGEYEIGCAEQLTSALARWKPDIIITDYALSNFEDLPDGRALIEKAKEILPNIPFVLRTAAQNDTIERDPKGYAVVGKRLDIDSLHTMLQESLSHSGRLGI